MIAFLLNSIFTNQNRFIIAFVPLWLLSSNAQALADDDGSHIVRGFLKGVASWYGSKFHGRKTASGQIFDQNAYTCAHRTLPFGTHLLVKNPATGIECVVAVNDRGPYKKKRVLDLSRAAARKLKISGVASVMYKTVKYVAKKVGPEDDDEQEIAAITEPAGEKEAADESSTVTKTENANDDVKSE